MMSSASPPVAITENTLFRAGSPWTLEDSLKRGGVTSASPKTPNKAASPTADGKFGGIYIWKDEASANAWFTPAWHDRVLKEYGQPASLEWFDTPILLPGQDAGGAWVKGGNPS